MSTTRLTEITSTALTRMMPSSSGVSRAATASCASRPRPGIENTRLDDDAAAEHGRRLQAEHGDQRQQRVARDMGEHDAPARQAARPGGEHEIHAPDLGHAGAHHAQIEREIDEAEGCRPAAPDGGRCRRRGRARSCPRRSSRCRPAAASAARPRRRRSAPARARSWAPRRAPASRSTAGGRACCPAARRRRCRAASRGRRRARSRCPSAAACSAAARGSRRAIGREKVTDQPRSRWASAQR